MTYHEITLKVPEDMYDELIQVQQKMCYPNVPAIISDAVQRYLAEFRHEIWHLEFRQLQKQIQAEGGFSLGETKAEVIANLRKQRQQIFEEDYAHLY
jgi:hypothetical protein